MNVVEELQSIDLKRVIDKMTAYAIYRLKGSNIKSFNGKEAIDFVDDVILKCLDGTRSCEQANCTIEAFLFGCLRSEISNFFKTNNKFILEKLDANVSNEEDDGSMEKEKEYAIGRLKTFGADDEELLVFECWLDGITKARDVAKELGIEIALEYNITKRLKRHLSKF